MIAKARKLIKRAIQLHLKEDGASDTGAYRDVITEVLHFAHKKFRNLSTEELDDTICEEGYLEFLEELEHAELRRLNRIPDKNLPLHSTEEFKFKSIQRAFEFRLKGEPRGKKKT